MSLDATKYAADGLKHFTNAMYQNKLATRTDGEPAMTFFVNRLKETLPDGTNAAQPENAAVSQIDIQSERAVQRVTMFERPVSPERTAHTLAPEAELTPSEQRRHEPATRNSGTN